MTAPTVVIDNGGCVCRIGVAGEQQPRAVFQNAVAKTKVDGRTLMGLEIDQCTAINQLHFKRPMDRGFLVGPRLQANIWSQMMEVSAFEVSMPTHLFDRFAMKSAHTQR
jgi:actin-related protein